MKKKQVVLVSRQRRTTDGSTNNRSESNTSSEAMRGNIRYGECQKNHAASIGGYAVDGCREFMASGDEGTNEALTCAACGCHRNFHRREVDTAEVVCEYTPPAAADHYNTRR